MSKPLQFSSHWLPFFYDLLSCTEGMEIRVFQKPAAIVVWKYCPLNMTLSVVVSLGNEWQKAMEHLEIEGNVQHSEFRK